MWCLLVRRGSELCGRKGRSTVLGSQTERSSLQLCCSGKFCLPGPTLLLAATQLDRQALEKGTFSHCSPSLCFPCFLALGSLQNSTAQKCI